VDVELVQPSGSQMLSCLKREIVSGDQGERMLMPKPLWMSWIALQQLVDSKTTAKP